MKIMRSKPPFILSEELHAPLPAAYLNLLLQAGPLRLVVVGKDPFPTAPTGIPFCKATWLEQADPSCSGRHVLNSLGFGDLSVRMAYETPTELFVYLAQHGIGFLNVSYYVLKEEVRKRRHKEALVEALTVNQEIIERAKFVLFCGEAKRHSWHGSAPPQFENVIHPDDRNRINKNRVDEWTRWWGPNTLKRKFSLI